MKSHLKKVLVRFSNVIVIRMIDIIEKYRKFTEISFAKMNKVKQKI